MRRWILLSLASVVVTAGAVVLYLQTSDGFHRVVVPLVARFSGGELHVGRGRVSVLGRLEVEELSFRDPARGIDAHAGVLSLHVAPLSFFGAGPPTVYAARISDGRVAIATRTEPEREEPPASDAESAEQSGAFEIPLRVDELAIDRFTLVLAGTETISVAVPELRLGNLEPGKVAHATLAAEVTLPEGPEPGQAGVIRATIDLAQGASGALQGAQAAVSGRFAAQGPVPSLGFSAKLDAKVEKESDTTVTLSLDTTQNDRPSGGAHATARWQAREPEGGLVIDASALRSVSLDLQGISARMLNPALLLAGFRAMEQGQIDGRVDLDTGPDRVLRVTANVEAAEMSARLADGAATPPLDLHLSQRGSWSEERRHLEVDEVVLRIATGGRSVLVAQLESPLSIDFRGEGRASEAEKNQTADLTITVDRLEAAHLKQWLGSFESTAFDRLAEGTLNGRLLVRTTASGRQVAVEGDVSLQGLQLHQPAGQPIGPLIVASRLKGKITDFRNVETEQLRCAVGDAGGTLLAAEITGTADLEASSGRARLALAADDLSRALASLKTLSPGLERNLRGGRTTAELDLTMAGANAGLGLKGQASVGGLTLQAQDGRAATHDLSLTADLQASSGQPLILNQLVVAIDGAAGAERGTIRVRGSLPIAAASEPQQLTFTAERLPLGPWLEAFANQRRDVLGSLPLTGTARITMDGSGVTTVEGQEQIAVVPAGAERPGRFDLIVEHSLRRSGDNGIDFSVDLTVPRKGQAGDEVGVKGTWGGPADERARGRLKLEVDATRVDLEPYWAASPPRLAHGNQDAVARTTRPLTADGGGEVGGLDLDLDVQIGKVRFREIAAESGRIQAQRSAADTRIQVSNARLLGGSLDGVLNWASGRQRLSWNVRAGGLDVGALSRSLGTADGARVEGRLDLTTAAEGSGATASELRDRLSGSISADLADARFTGTPFFSYLARTTGIKEFENAFFDRCNGAAQLGRGRATIEHLECSGLAMNMVASGGARLTGELDVLVNPRLGPSFSGNLEKIFGVGLLVKTASGFLALPLDVAVTGVYSDPKFALKPRAPGALEKLPGAGMVLEAGEAVGSGLLHGAGKLLQGGKALLGGGRKGEKKKDR